jgi:hypothetical protein
MLSCTIFSSMMARKVGLLMSLIILARTLSRRSIRPETGILGRFHDFVVLYAMRQSRPHPLPLLQKRSGNFAGLVDELPVMKIMNRSRQLDAHQETRRTRSGCHNKMLRQSLVLGPQQTALVHLLLHGNPGSSLVIQDSP